MATHITIKEVDTKPINRGMIIIDDMIYLDNPGYASLTEKNMVGMELEIFFNDVEINLEMLVRMRELYYLKQKVSELFTGERFDMVRTAVNQEIKDLEINGEVAIVAFDE